MSKRLSPRRPAKKKPARSPSTPRAAGSPPTLPGPNLPQFLSIEQVAMSLGVSVKTVRRHIARGTLPARRCGRRVLIGRADLLMFAASLSPVV